MVGLAEVRLFLAPHRSPDLTAFNLFFKGCVMNIVHSEKFGAFEEAHLSAIMTITPEMIQRT